jgi:hypothetical protein
MPTSKPAPRRYSVIGWLRKDLGGRVGFRDSIRLLRCHPKLWILFFRDLAIADGVTFFLLWLLEQHGFSLRDGPFLAMAATLAGGLTAGRLSALKRAEQEQNSDLLYVLKRTKPERDSTPPSGQDPIPGHSV